MIPSEEVTYTVDQPGPDQALLDPDTSEPTLPRQPWNHPLRPQTREHTSQEREQIRSEDNRFRLVVLPAGENLHLHPIEILPSSRDHARDFLQHGHRHVVLRLYRGRAVHRYLFYRNFYQIGYPLFPGENEKE